MYKAWTELVGETFLGIRDYAKQADLVLRLASGEVGYNAIGDCCSQSWIESLDNFDELVGQEIVEANADLSSDPITGESEPEYSDVISYTRYTLRGNKGTLAVVEFRNNSNGYYSGWLEPTSV